MWALLALVGLLWPSRIIGPLDGPPFDQRLEALMVGLALPLLWYCSPDWTRQRVAKSLIAALVAWKLVAWVLLPQGGWCGSFLTRYDPPLATERVGLDWDLRTWLGRAPNCSGIVARPLRRPGDFPGWSVNMPYDFSQSLDPRENPRPPRGHFAMEVRGVIVPTSAGMFTIPRAPGVTVTKLTIDGAEVSERGAALGPAVHSLFLRLDLEGNEWHFEPQWNDRDLFAQVVTAVDPPSSLQRVVLDQGWIVTATLVLLLVGVVAGAAVRAVAPTLGTAVATAAIAATAGAVASLGIGPARYAVLILVACAALPLRRDRRDARTFWLVVGVPWLVIVARIFWREIGRWALYTLGDDFSAYQRYAYRIFMQGYWIEGGERAFWNQPLYRWIVGALHAVYGGSRIGEAYLDGFAVLVGALFAFEVVRRVVSVRAGIVAGVATVLTVCIGPSWYVLGRGLPEIAATGFLYAAAVCLLDRGKPRHAIAAGVCAALAFYTRLNHLPVVVALAVLTLPLSTTTGDLVRQRWWRTVATREALLYAAVVSAAVVALMLRSWHYSGTLNIFAGTQRNHVSTGLGLTTLFSTAAWRRAIESVLFLVTIQDPPRFDPRAFVVIAGVAGAALAAVGVPVVRRLPLPLVVLALAGVAGGLVTRGSAYLGRFSVHLIPVGAAITTILAAWIAERGAPAGIGTPESESGAWRVE